MSLTKKDQKILWTRAGNLCSYNFNGERCSNKLSETTPKGDNFTIGHECHIIGENPTSARYSEDCPNKETYANRILLCRNCHATVDNDEKTYTVEVLRNMKCAHEKYIAELKNKDEQPTRMEIKDAHFTTTAKNVERAVGMEVNRPAHLENVRTELTAENVREAIGFSTNQGISSIMTICSCGHSFPYVCTGGAPSTIRCPYCGREHKLKS